jgi:cellulose synthase/poly-beta-1,6-N-acetylglucosamine synthase-like glycosyltransferase
MLKYIEKGGKMLMEIIKDILKFIYYAIDMFVIIYSIYYIFTGLFSFINKNNSIRKYKAKNRLAVIIAARNEEKVIPHLLDSLNKQNYPKNLYDVFVVPNNCDDNTEKLSLEKGAKVIECNNPVSSKGEVLKYTFKYMNTMHPEYDAYIIFDADNIVHPEFLRRMNDSLCSGYSVAQGYRDSKNPSDTWISCCYSLFYMIQNFFFNKARMNMGWSSSINGTGFMISKEVLEKNGFDTVTMTEDIEFAAQCAINGEKIAFVRDAITYDEQPLTFAQSWKQRMRWSMGTIQCLRTYFNKLVKTGYTKGIPQCMDMALFFLAPIVQLISIFIVIMLFIYNIADIQVSDIVKYAYDNKFFSLVFGYLVSVFIAVFIVILEKKKIRRTIKGILTLSVFMLTWIPINAICLIKKEYVWEPIEHNRTVNIDSIIEVNVNK